MDIETAIVIVRMPMCPAADGPRLQLPYCETNVRAFES
jgi:hypothetical protein